MNNFLIKPHSKKKHLMIALLLLCCILLTGNAFGESLQVVEGQQNQDMFRFYISVLNDTNQATSVAVSDMDAYSVRIEGQTAYAPTQIDANSALDLGTHFIVLVDVSRSMSEKQISDTKAALTTFVSSMGSQDFMSLYTVGRSFTTIQQYSNERFALQESISTALHHQDNATILYESLRKSLQLSKRIVHQNEDGFAKRTAIIVISDGNDDSDSADTAASVLAEAKINSIPIYAIAVKTNYTDTSLFSQLCDETGGVLFIDQKDDVTITSALDNIQNIANQTFAITCEITDSDYFGIIDAKWNVAMQYQGATINDWYIMTSNPMTLVSTQAPMTFFDDSNAFQQAIENAFQRTLTVDEEEALLQLESLHIEAVQLTSLKDLNRMLGLKSLQLENCSIQNVSEVAWGQLQNLETLILANNEDLSDISHLAGAQSLVSLDLSGTNVLDITPVSILKNLENLDVSNTNIDSVEAFLPLTNLQTLNISNTNITNIDALEPLQASGCVLNIDNLSIATPTPETTPQATTPMPTPEPSWTDKLSAHYLFFVAVIACALLLLVVILFITLHKRKTKNDTFHTIESLSNMSLDRTMRIESKSGKTSCILHISLYNNNVVSEHQLPIAEHGIIKIGRMSHMDQKQNDFDLCIDNQTVSAPHCQIELRYNGMYVKDLGSTNGSTLNNIALTTEEPIKQSDVLKLGTASITIGLIESSIVGSLDGTAKL